jgi:putative isomerase
MKRSNSNGPRWVLVERMFCYLALFVAFSAQPLLAQSDTRNAASENVASQNGEREKKSAQYTEVQNRLAQGWNTWDVNSVITHVLLPEGLALHIGLKHNTTLYGDNYLSGAQIGRQSPDAEQVFPGPHTWNGSYTALRLIWMGHSWRVRSSHVGKDLVLLAEPLPSTASTTVTPTIVFSANFLWNRPGTARRDTDHIEARTASGVIPIYCTCADTKEKNLIASVHGLGNTELPVSGPYFSLELNRPVGISTGKPRSLPEIQSIIDQQYKSYKQSLSAAGKAGDIVDAIETTLGWDTIFEPEGQRVISPVSRVWSVGWGGYVIFDWDTFFAATMAGVGDRDLAYADAIETLRESTAEGFVPNYARAGGWRSSDRSEPPVGSITVLGLYEKFHDRWFLEDTFRPLLRWNRWWAEHRDFQGYMSWGSDGENKPEDLDDKARGTREGAILESGLDNSPMYDSATYDAHSHVLQFADVGLMSMYIADCDALAAIAQTLEKPEEAKELRDRSSRYRAKLETLWSDPLGMFLNKDLQTGQSSVRLSPTNFYPLLARVATPAQAEVMLRKHLQNPDEFWGSWIIPSIARNDPAFHDQNYWRGRVWGPMNFLVYLGLRNYYDAKIRQEFAEKSYELFLKEWREKGHVHENYNAMTGTGDDVSSSDRFYHWGALLGYVEYVEQTEPVKPSEIVK